MQHHKIFTSMLAAVLMLGWIDSRAADAPTPPGGQPAVKTAEQSAADKAAAEKAAKEAAIAAAMAAPPAEGAMLANTCAGCHGTDGISGGPTIPSIAGFPAPYLKRMMTEFKSGKYPSTVMGRIAKGYTEEEIARIADFYAHTTWKNGSSNPNSLTASKVDPSRAKKGKALVEAQKCGKCHEDEGRIQDEDTPRLAGQWLDYLLIRMQDFKNPKWPVPLDDQMKRAIDRLSPAELEEIAHFYASKR